MPVSSRQHQTRQRRSKAWIPDQHGAWFMVTVPALTGFALAPSLPGVAVLIVWWCGYFAFFAASIWMRARFNTRDRRPVLVYTALTALAGIVTLVCDWTLLRWAPLFVPLVAIAVWEIYRRRPRSLASGVSTVIAACLMTPVVASASTSLNTPDARTWAICAVYLGFFVGTIPYVKTLIRERGSRAWLTGSIAYHVVLLAAALIARLLIDDPNILSWSIPAVAAVLLFRAIAMPVAAARCGTPWKAKTVGMLDAFLTVTVVLAAW